MKKRETAIQNEIRIALSQRREGKLFRVNVGQAWTGNEIRQMEYGAILIRDARPFKTGLPRGFSDLFGYTMVEVTEDMIGQKLPVFTAIEVKTEHGRVSDSQQQFLDIVGTDGAICGVARSVDDALGIVGE